MLNLALALEAPRPGAGCRPRSLSSSSVRSRLALVLALQRDYVPTRTTTSQSSSRVFVCSYAHTRLLFARAAPRNHALGAGANLSRAARPRAALRALAAERQKTPPATPRRYLSCVVLDVPVVNQVLSAIITPGIASQRECPARPVCHTDIHRGVIMQQTPLYLNSTEQLFSHKNICRYCLRRLFW